MNRRLTGLLALVTVTVLAGATHATALPAQPADQAEDARAKALEIIARHVEASGGEAAIRAHKNVTSEGSLAVPSIGIRGTLVSYLQAPDKALTRIDLPDLGLTMNGFDGETAWMIDPTLGALLMEDDMRDSFIRASRIDADLRMTEEYTSITYTGEEEIDARPVSVIRLVDSNGRETTQYYDTQTGLRTASDTLEPTPYGDLQVRYVFSDYKSFQGVKFPMKTIQHVGPQSIVLTIETVSFDPIPDETFDPPAAIKVLVDRQADNDDADDDDDATDDDEDDGDDDEADDD